MIKLICENVKKVEVYKLISELRQTIAQVKGRKDSEFAKKIFAGTLWLTIGTVVNRGGGLLTSIILVRIFTDWEFGEYGMIRSTMDNFLIFASMGIGLTTTKYVAELKNTDKAGVSSLLGASLSLVLIMSISLALIIIVFASYIVDNIFKNANLLYPLIVSAIVLILIAVNGTQVGTLLGLQSYRKKAFLDILQGLFVLTAVSIGAYVGSVLGALIGYLSAMVCVVLISQWVLHFEGQKIGISVCFYRWGYSIKKICKFAIPASLSSIIVAPTIWLLNSMLAKQDNGYRELGLYSAVIIFSTAIQVFNGSINSVLLPIFLSKSEKKTSIQEFFNYFGSWIVSIFMAIPLLMFPEMVIVLLGGKYNANQVVPILAGTIISTLVITSKAGISRDLIAQNRMWLSVFSMGQWALSSLLLFLFLQSLGALGLALACMFSYVINYLLFVPFFIRVKVAPRVIFYSVWIHALWLVLFILALIMIFCFDIFILRGLLSVLCFILVLLFVVKLYKQCLREL